MSDLKTAELPIPAKVRWRCRRGMLELDMLLMHYYDQFYADLTNDEKAIFVDFLSENDNQLRLWLLTKAKDIPEQFSELIHKILAAAQYGTTH